MRIKNGVRFHSPGDAMAAAVHVVSFVCRSYSVDCCITGGIEKHEPPSKHVTGGGLDFRTRDFPSLEDLHHFYQAVTERLGDGFDVVLESDHLHVEYDPKT